MAFLETSNVKIKGVSACVPKGIADNYKYPLNSDELNKLISYIGVEQKRIVSDDVCASDLSCKAADVLIEELKWDKKEIDCLVFVSQTPDYILPATSCILQDRLGLTNDCYTIDIPLGCSGWVYGLSSISSLMFSGKRNLRKGLLLASDTISKIVSINDKSTYPLFGDAGTAVALEYCSDDNECLKFHLATDGGGLNAIIIPDGAYRNIVTPKSLESFVIEDGITRNNLNLALDGMNVFSFAISKAPQSVNQLIEYFKINRSDIDYYLFHQANFFLNEKIRKKLKLESDKVPYSLKKYGNTSCASIPLTLVTELRERLISQKLNHIACGFGVGLSWGSVNFTTDRIICPKLIEY